MKCSISLCSCTNSHSTDSYPRIKIKVFYQQALIVLCKGEKSLIDHNIPLNINYFEQYYFNRHKYYTENSILYCALEKHNFFFFFYYYCFLIASQNSRTAATFFPSSGSRNRETTEWAEIMLVGKTYGGAQTFLSAEDPSVS